MMSGKEDSTPVILIIDDDQSVLESLGFYLEDAGFSIMLATDGESGLETLFHNDISCVLTDLRMPGISGIEVIKAVVEYNPDIPVVVISGTDDIAGVTEAFRQGAWDYILKPIEDMMLLEHRIDSILEKSSLKAETRQYQLSLERLVSERTAQLNETVANLQKAETKLKSMNLELEDIVAQRTESLNHAICEIAKKDRILALNRLVSGFSHEVNTPVGVSVSGITFIKDNLTELSDNGNLNKVQQEAVDSCLQASVLIYKNLLKTNKLMKSFQAVSTEREKKEAQIVEGYKLLRTISRDNEKKLKSAGITLRLDSSEELFFLSFPMSIIQIVENLMNNSLLHGYPEPEAGDGEIIISLFSDGKDVLLIYEDDGNGMDEDVLHRMYDPFFTTSNDPEHPGLGLSIVYNTVTDGLNGSLECNSSPGKGVKYTIRFPYEAAAVS